MAGAHDFGLRLTNDMIGSGRGDGKALSGRLRAAVSVCFLGAIVVFAVWAASPAPAPAPQGSAWLSPPSPGRPVSAAFQRGVCYAHIHRRSLGYGSDQSRETLTRLRGFGVTWLSLTP